MWYIYYSKTRQAKPSKLKKITEAKKKSQTSQSMSNIHSSNFCLIFPGETHILLSTSIIWYVGNTEFWILVSWRVALGPSALLGSSGNFVRSEHRPADPRLTACAATRTQMIAVHVAFWHHPSVPDVINNLTHCFLQKFKTSTECNN